MFMRCIVCVTYAYFSATRSAAVASAGLTSAFRTASEMAATRMAVPQLRFLVSALGCFQKNNTTAQSAIGMTYLTGWPSASAAAASVTTARDEIRKVDIRVCVV